MGPLIVIHEGRLRILQQDALLWFSPNAWLAIASTSATRAWATQP